jgi:chemotaxis family two-component system response regulator Rcp1
LESLNDFTVSPNIQARAWGSPFARKSLNAQEEESGWTPSRGTVQRFSLPSPFRETPSQTLVPLTILLVEDNPADARLVRESLEDHGIHGELIVVSDGESAINLIAVLDTDSNKCVDLAIIDLNLPKRPGKDVLAAMRSSVNCAATPVIVLSSSDAIIDREEAAHLGANRYIRKPTRLDDFMKLGSVFKEVASRSKQE